MSLGRLWLGCVAIMAACGPAPTQIVSRLSAPAGAQSALVLEPGPEPRIGVARDLTRVGSSALLADLGAGLEARFYAETVEDLGLQDGEAVRTSSRASGALLPVPLLAVLALAEPPGVQPLAATRLWLVREARPEVCPEFRASTLRIPQITGAWSLTSGVVDDRQLVLAAQISGELEPFQFFVAGRDGVEYAVGRNFGLPAYFRRLDGTVIGGFALGDVRSGRPGSPRELLDWTLGETRDWFLYQIDGDREGSIQEWVALVHGDDLGTYRAFAFGTDPTQVFPIPEITTLHDVSWGGSGRALGHWNGKVYALRSTGEVSRVQLASPDAYAQGVVWLPGRGFFVALETGELFHVGQDLVTRRVPSRLSAEPTVFQGIVRYGPGMLVASPRAQLRYVNPGVVECPVFDPGLTPDANFRVVPFGLDVALVPTRGEAGTRAEIKILRRLNP